MRNALLLLIAAMFAVSCNNKPDAPARLLSRDKMEDVLWDMMRADLFLNNYMVIKDTALNKKQQGIELYSQILKMHKISQEQFRESFLFYRTQPLELKDMMDSLSRRSDSSHVKKTTKTPEPDIINPPAPAPVPADTVKKAGIPRSKAE